MKRVRETIDELRHYIARSGIGMRGELEGVDIPERGA